MPRGRTIVDSTKFGIIINRLAEQLVENHGQLTDTYLIGIQERGVMLAERLISQLKATHGIDCTFGKLDITFYRDDFRQRDKPLKASETQIDFDIEGKTLILVDDVVYSGRTIHAAIAALQDFGRPDTIKLLCMVDRRFNRHLPIQTDYTGVQVDALDEAYVRVNWQETNTKDEVLIYSAK